ncbi:hypothetical protein SLNSH_24145 [Alsobacter soli]|uniref:Secreted protein n=1 Tax=Alsobacter soli TaxID=2109933 RepID=A0A2T1HLA7_9HYPH|nr:hypothetical protein SLNSH_24145 [Alsobacter soli]
MMAPACLPTSATVALSVMAGLVPAIHACPQRVDPRDKPGDDDRSVVRRGCRRGLPTSPGMTGDACRYSDPNPLRAH